MNNKSQAAIDFEKYLNDTYINYKFEINHIPNISIDVKITSYSEKIFDKPEDHTNTIKEIERLIKQFCLSN